MTTQEFTFTPPPLAATFAARRQHLAQATERFRAASGTSGEGAAAEYAATLSAHLQEGDQGIDSFVPEPVAARRARLTAAGRELLAQYPDPATRPPLFGVPFGVKDAYFAAGLPVRVGTRLEPEFFRELTRTAAWGGEGQDAEAVRCLRAAGALVLGLTVSTELTYFAPGPTKNPWNLAHTPGGSSSGSAAALAAGLCPLALGTQTIGSIVRPAAFCGVVGIKPGRDRASRVGLVPLSPATDHAGVMAADFACAAIATAAISISWRTLPPEHPSRARRAVLGIPRGPFLEAASPLARRHLDSVVGRLRAAGWEVRDAPTLNDFPDVAARHRRLLAAEVARTHPWIPARASELDARTVALYETGMTISDNELNQLRAGRDELRATIEGDAARAGIDLWITPAAPGPAPAGLGATGDPAMNLPWTQAGLPGLGFPAGWTTDGLPLGIQLVGQLGEDEALLAWADPIAAAVAAW